MVKRAIGKITKISGEEIKGVAKEAIVKQVSWLRRLENFLYEPPWLKVPIVLVLAFLLELLISSGLDSNSLLLHSLRALLLLFVSLYLVFFVVHLIGRSIKTLQNAKNLWTLFFGYALFIFSIILFFSAVYDTVEKLDLGYLKYGQCSDNYSPEIAEVDTLATTNYFYFSSVTLFTVGYGDICPMGAAKTVAIINSFIGNFVNVVLMFLILANYMRRRENGDNGV